MHPKYHAMIVNSVFLGACIRWTARLSPYLTASIYGVCGMSLVLQKNWVGLFAYLLPPLILYLLVSRLRRKCNRQRPFEKYGYKPLIPHAPGNAFPSRHAACAAVLFLSVLRVSTIGGVISAVLCVLIGASRVLAGVHAWEDVAVGTAMGLLIGCFGYFI